jgi:hypothetical protein
MLRSILGNSSTAENVSLSEQSLKDSSFVDASADLREIFPVVFSMEDRQVDSDEENEDELQSIF